MDNHYRRMKTTWIQILQRRQDRAKRLMYTQFAYINILDFFFFFYQVEMSNFVLQCPVFCFQIFNFKFCIMHTKHICYSLVLSFPFPVLTLSWKILCTNTCSYTIHTKKIIIYILCLCFSTIMSLFRWPKK